MTLQAPRGRLVVWLTLLAGLVFQIMPLPALVEGWRPDWLLMVMIYWAMALPHRYNILTAWLLGVVLDVMLGATFGVRALGFSLVTYVVVLHFQRLRNFPMWQQALVITSLIVLYHLVVFWAEYVLQKAQFNVDVFWPALSSLFIWPWAFWLLRRLRRRYKVR
ncbi:rod shape-determining protein MreD [Shewanella cyperi]|uniref:Rod shape-determining protein MreD n=2 Tax=Shewanella TaxID=22 RepID=A0A975AKX7_9GAMM|nr:MULTISPECIES: rod shape-determining protein MreD [Shewanella]QSX29673.1 rod shape-determining protein MreD [Shewanella cyperi]QSX36847.1 rod shape-determining protein MreD [Shewanella sedimentimangrovi]